MRILARSSQLTWVAVLSAPSLFLLAGSAASSAQIPAGPAVQADAPASFAFDSVTIYPVPPEHQNGHGFLWWGIPNMWSTSDVPLLTPIADAYGLGIRQIFGFPEWVGTDRYDLSTTMAPDKLEAFKQLPIGEQMKQRQLMMQAVLAVRCQLKAHRETRELPVYELVVAKAGLKIADRDIQQGQEGASYFVPGEWRNHGTMQSLAGNLAEPAGRVVIDKTGLGTRTFLYSLKWTPDSKGGTPSGGHSIFTALEEQLGLELVPATETVDVLAIDQIEKPAPGYPGPPSGQVLASDRAH
jgi:uncharacterized protein (TIGR03435 family)